MPSSRIGHNVLVIANDPMLAALVGQLVEMARFRATFPRLDEDPVSAFVRLRPVAVVLLDAESGASRSDVFVTRARRAGAEVMVFGSESQIEDAREWASARDVQLFALPEQISALSLALEQLHKPTQLPRQASRRAARVETGAEGEMVFRDDRGVAWSIYDRRIERRRNPIDRRFVSESGEVRHCHIGVEDAQSKSPQVIAAQLERSTPG